MASALPAAVAPATPAMPRSADADASGVTERHSGKQPESFRKVLQDAGARVGHSLASTNGKARADGAGTEYAGYGQAGSDQVAAPARASAIDLAGEPTDALALDVLIPGWPTTEMGSALGAPLPGLAGASLAAAGFAATGGWSQGAANAAALALVATPLAEAIAVASGSAQALVPAILAAVSPAAVPTANTAGATMTAMNAMAAGGPVASLLLPDFDALSRRQDGGDGEAPAPFALAPASNAAGAPLGLARASVVNLMNAPSADLHGDDFAETVGSRLTWMAEQKIGHAHIRINPAELGPVEIRMRLDGERVHADFSSGQAEVRQALESSLPRLREMLAAQGFSLGQAGVGDHGQPPSSDARGGGSGTSENPTGATEQGVEPAPARLAPRGLLDAYA